MRQCHRLWKIAEFEEIVDIHVLQIEIVWFSGSDLSSFFLWHAALHTDCFSTLTVSTSEGAFLIFSIKTSGRRIVDIMKFYCTS